MKKQLQKTGSSQEWRDTGIVQSQQPKLEIMVISEAQPLRFITLIFVKMNVESWQSIIFVVTKL